MSGASLRSVSIFARVVRGLRRRQIEIGDAQGAVHGAAGDIALDGEFSDQLVPLAPEA
jgi:hypothetical protein